ncbi:MAG TPA: hypothetical protein VGI25_00985 [Candidatus Udaeobacter sp.]
MNWRQLAYAILVILVAASSLAATYIGFPTEEQLKSNLHVGMSVDEVVAIFGQPSGQRGLRGHTTFSFQYAAPASALTEQREGYVGFEVEFLNGRVKEYREFRANPSYASEFKPPREVKWFLWFYGLCGVALLALIRLVRRGGRILAYRGILDHYRTRTIAAGLPHEFGFVTHNVTLKQVVDRLGSPSRFLQLVVPESSPPGFSFVTTSSGQRAIVVAEYQMPYHAPVYVMPEFPFDVTSTIRAVFQGQLEVESLVEPYGGDPGAHRSPDI